MSFIVGFCQLFSQDVPSGVEVDKFFFSEKYPYSKPLISPDGKYFLVTTEGNFGIYVFDVKSERLKGTVRPGARIGFDVTWSDNSEFIFFKEKVDSYFQVFKVSLDDLGHAEKISTSSHTTQSIALQASNKEVLLSINPSNLQIEVSDQSGRGKYFLTSDNGRYYAPVLSFDKQYVVAHSGADMVLISMQDPSEKKIIGQGIATCFSYDHNLIYFFRDLSEDGHHTTASDIYQYNIQTQEIKNLTQTPHLIEMWPSISRNGVLMYEETKHHQVYLSKLKK